VTIGTRIGRIKRIYTDFFSVFFLKNQCESVLSVQSVFQLFSYFELKLTQLNRVLNGVFLIENQLIFA
jgi:hypothetical protein